MVVLLRLIIGHPRRGASRVMIAVRMAEMVMAGDGEVPGARRFVPVALAEANHDHVRKHLVEDAKGCSAPQRHRNTKEATASANFRLPDPDHGQRKESRQLDGRQEHRQQIWSSPRSASPIVTATVIAITTVASPGSTATALVLTAIEARERG